MRLFIAEKPSLARAIAAGLGNGLKRDGYIECGDDIVTWCFGHILSLCDAHEYDERYKYWKMEDLPIIPKKWNLKVSKNCNAQFNVIKKLAESAEIIVNAGDPDREGQLLVDEVLSFIGVLDSKKIQRILLNALDDASVKSALNDLKDNKEFTGLRNSALARQRADWTVGINLTRAYTIKARAAGYDNTISVGRVQTPTLALVVRREEEIKNFKPQDYFKLLVEWQHPNGMIKTVWQPKEELTDQEGRLLDKSVAEKCFTKIKNSSGEIINVEEKKGSSSPRLPYSLSALQIDAGKKYGYSPQEVLDVCQELYESKLTTYPRSDCDYLPENQLADASHILKNLSFLSDSFSSYVMKADLSLRSKAWNDKKITAHHAIIPTTVKADIGKLTDQQKKIYLLIAKAYIAQFFPAQTFLSTKILIKCAEEKFLATGKVILSIGWKEIYQSDKDEHDADAEVNADEKSDQHLPQVNNGDQVQFTQADINACVTKPPSRFNPSTLLKAMKEIYKYVKDDKLKVILKECSGIGTEATRAGIIQQLQDKGFVKIVKKYLVPTDTAYMMINVIAENLTYPDITALWEKNLEAISRREMSIQDFFDQQKIFIDSMISCAKEVKVKPAAGAYFCPKCKKPLVKRKGKKGYFWGCSGYPECKAIFLNNNGKPILD